MLRTIGLLLLLVLDNEKEGSMCIHLQRHRNVADRTDHFSFRFGHRERFHAIFFFGGAKVSNIKVGYHMKGRAGLKHHASHQSVLRRSDCLCKPSENVMRRMKKLSTTGEDSESRSKLGCQSSSDRKWKVRARSNTSLPA